MSTYFEYRPESPDAFDAYSVIVGSMENDADAVLFDSEALPPAFFDLSSGVAGDLLHRLSVYKVRMAGIVPDPTKYSERFQEFMREANKGNQYRFFPNRDEAVAWLESN